VAKTSADMKKGSYRMLIRNLRKMKEQEQQNEALDLDSVKPRIKSTCNKCRASEFHNECSLGYSCDNYTPKEPCPKPLTIHALINAPKYGA
jgi:hypothetical protein